VVTFRRWRRPRARVGGRHRTPAGVLAVNAVTVVDPAAITEDDARAAGFGSLAEVRAADLAAAAGRERLAFKGDVRKLNELGLTESLEVGYRLSPRGRALLEWLDAPTARE
jgi:hypothetical protein